VRYGVTPEMFPIMGTVLIETLEEMLKESFTKDIKAAWIETYGALSSDMIRAHARASRRKSG